jgi:serine/threonine protein kinase
VPAEAMLKNEIRVIRQLLEKDIGNHLVMVFHHDQHEINHQLFCDIDMELCMKNLKEDIRERRNMLVDLLTQFVGLGSGGATSAKRNERKQGIWTELRYILDVLEDILLGLEFIHEMKMVHRDIKPDNGIHRLLKSN